MISRNGDGLYSEVARLGVDRLEAEYFFAAFVDRVKETNSRSRFSVRTATIRHVFLDATLNRRMAQKPPLIYSKS